jgi:type I restriction-modification system DNA methylase subunit
MITKLNLKQSLVSLGFQPSSSNQNLYELYIEKVDSIVKVDFESEKILYPKGVSADRATTKNFSKNENFVVLDCVVQLLKIGYRPEHIVLEPKTPGGREDSFFYGDILVWDNSKRPYLLIECKTTENGSDDQLTKAWEKAKIDGGQLFNYYNTYRQAQYLCLYASDYVDTSVKRQYYSIQMNDIDEIVGGKKNLLTYKRVREDLGGKDAYFRVWKQTYGCHSENFGIFEEEYEPFNIGQQKRNIDDLLDVDSIVIDKKYHHFRETLRKYNVASHENAFDKLVNLFLAKIVDEDINKDDLQFCWKGQAHDDYYKFQDRLQRLYKIGMEDYLNEIVTYVDDSDVENAFHLHKSQPDAIKETIIDYFHQIKFYSNSDFGFLDVHNEELFRQNAVILKDMVFMLQDIKIRNNKQPQFLGNLFENFLDQGVRQNEGQFFTPIPIACFMVSSLPLKDTLEKTDYKPYMIDYACGAGHFLTEYASQVKKIVENLQDGDTEIDVKECFKRIYGIEKEYRLSKVSKISSFMYNQEGINIIYGDALQDYANVKDGSFNVLIANPPFRVTGFLETLSEEQIAKYDLSSYIEPSNYRSFNNIEYYFVEKAKKVLSTNGIAAIILPNTTRTDNDTMAIKTREILLRAFDIISIVELSGRTFGKTATATSILFLRRRPDDVAKYAKQRVDLWFNNDHSQDYRFKDEYLLTDYCEYIGIAEEDYSSLINKSPNENLLQSEFWENYYDSIKDSNQYVSIAEKELSDDYTEQERNKDLEQLVVSYIIDIEKEKLEFFILTKKTPNSVVVVKVPTESSVAEKAFLGYEWSTAKNYEGAHVLGVQESANPDEIQRKGWDRIMTPLYNPIDLFDPHKINSLIRENYKENVELNITDEEIKKCVNIYPLCDLIDFATSRFDKAIGTTSMLQYPEIETTLDVGKLGKIAPMVTNKVPSTSIRIGNYISTDNMLQNRAGIEKFDGSISSANLTEYKKGDILVSNIRPYLKKIWLADCDGGCSNDVLVFRNIANNISNEYLYCILSSSVFFDYMMVGKTGTKMPRGNKRAIPNFKVPLLDPVKQADFVKEILKIEKRYNSLKNITGKRLKISSVVKQFEEYENSKLAVFNKYLNSEQ